MAPGLVGAAVAGLVPLLLALLLNGCASPPAAPEKEEVLEPPALVLPFEEPDKGPDELTSDMLFSYLVGEIGAQRGVLDESYGHYLHAAILASDPYAAERATRIATYRKDIPAALRAVRRWVALAPNSMPARGHAIVLLLRNQEPEAALIEARALIEIAEARRQDGFLHVAAVLIKEEDKGGALRLMRRLLGESATDARAHYALGVVESNAADFAAAERTLREALKLDPRHVQAHIQLARVLAAGQRKEEAWDLLEGAVRAQPENRALRQSLAQMLSEADQYSRALEHFEVLHRQNAADTESLLGLALVQTQLKEWAAARQSWQLLRKDKERHLEATFFLGQVEESDGNLQLAMGLYQTVTSGTLVVEAGIRLARLKGLSADLQGARADYQRLRLAHRDRAPEIYQAEAMLFEEIGYTAEARTVYEQALTFYPDNLDLRYGRGLLAANHGDVENAETHFRFVLAKQPDHANALNALGYTLADRTDRYQEALGIISIAHKLQPENPAILDSLGWVYFRLGEMEKALEYLNQALDKLKDPEIAAHLGEVLWVTGERRRAERVWAEALKLNPDSPILRSTMQRLR
jgi:tetratricopeptide (TPR) repeat protein